MLKTIAIEELTVDMYVAELIATPGTSMPKKKKGMVRDPRIIAKFEEIGVAQVVIDVTKGLDVKVVSDAPEEDNAPLQDSAIDAGLQSILQETSEAYRDLPLEWGTAKEVFDTSVKIVNRSIDAVKTGGKINPDYFRQAACAISRSVLRNKDALTWLLKFRDINSYLYEHSVNCAVLMGIFAHAKGLSSDQVQQCITGALMHDLGEAMIDAELFERAGPLSPDEYEQVKQHVFFGQELAREVDQMGEIALQVIQEHHERFDGQGYPHQREGSAISLYGRMFAIVDTYDAVSNNRTYKKALPSTTAMRTLLEAGGSQFDENLVHQFIKCLGVYPTGSLVKLNTGLLAVVIAHVPSHPLKPLVRTVYNASAYAYVEPRMRDLSRPDNTIKILGYEDPEKFGINVYEFMPLEFEL